MNHYLINKNRTSYGCNVTKDKNFKKKYIFFFTISQQQIQIPLNTLIIIILYKILARLGIIVGWNIRH